MLMVLILIDSIRPAPLSADHASICPDVLERRYSLDLGIDLACCYLYFFETCLWSSKKEILSYLTNILKLFSFI